MLKAQNLKDITKELFMGKLESYITCTDVEYKSTREEIFMDI